MDIIRQINHRYVLDMKDNLGKVKEDSQTTVGTPVFGLGPCVVFGPLFSKAHLW